MPVAAEAMIPVAHEEKAAGQPLISLLAGDFRVGRVRGVTLVLADDLPCADERVELAVLWSDGGCRLGADLFGRRREQVC